MPAIDLSILNQRQTPAFYADTLANRPAAGFVGRIFVSTNTLDLYRDNGTTWDLLSPSSTGTITGSGSAGQVTYFSAASSITGSNDLFWDNVNGHLGIGTNVPGTALQIDHDQNQFIRLNQTTATNDTKIAFQNSGVALWRIGNSYNAGANDFGIYDVVGAIQPVTVKKTTGQVLIGTSTVGSGKLVVASSTGDNGVQIVGAAAPSLRIDNAESGPTKRVGLGISTAANNFIQGSADRDFCLFNGSTTASPILFGIYDTTNVAEAARISAARNFLIGTTTDAGQKLQVSGTAYISSLMGIGTTSPEANSQLTLFGSTFSQFHMQNNTTGTGNNGFRILMDGNNLTMTNKEAGYWAFETNNQEHLRLSSGGNLLIGYTTDSGRKLQVNGDVAIGTTGSSSVRLFTAGSGTTSAASAFIASDSGGNTLLQARNDGMINTGLAAVSPYNNSTTGRSMVIENTGNLGYLVSTRESKTNINTLTPSNILHQLNPVSFNYRKKDIVNNKFTDEIYEDFSYGFIADEVEQIDKNLVFYDVLNDGSKKLAGVEYNKIIALLVKEIQELNTKIENLK